MINPELRPNGFYRRSVGFCIDRSYSLLTLRGVLGGPKFKAGNDVFCPGCLSNGDCLGHRLERSHLQITECE